LFPLLVIRLVFKRRVDEIANRLRFQFDLRERRHAEKGRTYFVLAPGAPTNYRLQRDRAIANPPRASNYFRGAEQPSDARLCRRSIKGRKIHGQIEVDRQTRDGVLHLDNDAPDVAAVDLFVVPTIGFKLLYAFVIVRLDRRDLVGINVTTNPTAEGIEQAS